ncbi:unnamed protein product, partial [Brenthis ino]
MEAIKESLSTMAEMFNSRMNEFQQDLSKTSTAPSITSIAADFSNFKLFIQAALTSLQKQVELLSRELDRMELRKRRKMLLFHGVAEKKSEDTLGLITSIVAEHLDLPNFSSASISSSYRLGHVIGEKPRPIVVKFVEAQVRDSVWFAKARLKGSGVTESEFLTKNRHDVFMEARRRYGVGKCWTKDGCINVLASDGKRYRVETLSDLQAIRHTTLASPKAVQDTVVVPKNSGAKITVQRTKRVLKK